MTNTIQTGANVTIPGIEFFNGKARTGRVVHVSGDMIFIDINGGNNWDGPWHFDRVEAA